MIKLLIGFFLGIVVATIGFSGLAQLADKQVENAKFIIKENVK